MIFVITLLNLLIAIISDSFEKVMALEKMATVYERLQLIIQSERAYGKGFFSRFWKSNDKKEKEFLMILNSMNLEQDEDVDERLRYKLDEIKKILLKSQTGMDDLHSKLDKLALEIKDIKDKSKGKDENDKAPEKKI